MFSNWRLKREEKQSNQPTPVIVTTSEELTWEVDCHYGQVTAGRQCVLIVASK